MMQLSQTPCSLPPQSPPVTPTPLPPRSSSNDTCSGWCTSPTQWPRNFSASSRSWSLAVGEDSADRSCSIAVSTQRSARGHSSAPIPAASRGRLTSCSSARFLG